MSAKHLARQIDDAAAVAAASAFLEHLAGRPEADFWVLPEEIQADVVIIGCDFADRERDAFASIATDPEILAEVWRAAAQRYQAEVDRLLLGASHGSGRA